MNTRKIKTVFFLPLLAAAPVFSQEQSVQFMQASWEEVKAKAKEEQKIIFLDAFAAWCGPCKWMSKNVFVNDTVADFYNDKFINAKIDMEKGEGTVLAKQYGVNAYPTLLFINPDGELVHRACGSKGTKDFIALGEDALDPEKQYMRYFKDYEKNKLNGEFILQYLEVLRKSCMETKAAVTAYFDAQPESDLTSLVNWSIIYKASLDVDSKVFNYLVANKEKYEAMYDDDSVYNRIFSGFESAIYRTIYAKEFKEAEFKSVKKKISEADFIGKQELTLLADKTYYEKTGNWRKFSDVSAQYIEKYRMDDYSDLNNTAWTFYEKVKDRAMLEKALVWAKKSVELKDEPFNNDTYAALLFKLGNLQEAIRVEEKALQLAKDGGEPTENYEEMIKMFKNGTKK